LRTPRHLAASFLAITVVPVAVLAWLTWRIFEQDRALAQQTVRDRLEHSADLIVAALERDLVQLEDQLAQSPPALLLAPNDPAVIVTFAGDRIDASPAGRLPWYPTMSAASARPRAVFDAGEELEFRQRDYDGAVRFFRELSHSKDPVVRGEALLRLARVLRKSGQSEGALAAYDTLAQLEHVIVAGVPAELLARDARGGLLSDLGRKDALTREATVMAEGLKAGRWRLDRASWLLYSRRAHEWLGESDEAATESAASSALAAGVDRLWEEWRGTPSGIVAQRRGMWNTGDGSVLVLWRGSRDTLTALVAEARFIKARYGDEWNKQQVRVTLSDSEGSVMGVAPKPGMHAAVRSAADTRLPWTVRITSLDSSADLAQLAGRRSLLLSGLTLTALALILGGYLTVRATARELAVARLQSDFVSAVSHEFRTPLTSLRHLTELLESGAVGTEERRQKYFATLSRETERLHRMVEGLLEFGQMEAGKRNYEFAAADPVQLVETVVADFQSEITATGRRVELGADGLTPGMHRVRVDREAFSRALRNLLENAVKYSNAPAPVSVDLSGNGSRVAIRVRDQGAGIPTAEQSTIFDQFVRGSAAKSMNIKGTGVGLSMVRHIVRAHGGEITIESEEGRGSTFTVHLPAESLNESGATS